MTEDQQNDIDNLLKYANQTPALLSLLYDIDLMPEQTMGRRDWLKTLTLIAAWRAEFNETK